MNLKKRVLGLTLCVALAACNTPPSRIAPVYQSSDAYEQLECKKIERQLVQIDNLVNAQRSQLQTDFNVDAGIVAGSLLILPIGLVALAATGNGELKNQYASNLGKQAALRQAMEKCE